MTRRPAPSRRAFGRLVCSVAFLLATAIPAGAKTPTTYQPVTQDRLLHAQQDDGWLMYRRSYDSKGYAPFTQITPENVSRLKVAFTYKTGLKQGHEAAPIVNGRYMFITTPMDHLIALDSKTGKVRWTYVKQIPKKALKTVCCGVVNRGVALYEDMVYMATLDNHVVALDAKTGKVQWDQKLEGPGIGYAMTLAPLVVDDKIVVGESGGEFGARDFIAALDAKSGKLVWKRFTVPTPDEPNGDSWPEGAYKHSGSPAWLTGSYDPDTHTLFWGVGNPGPWLAKLRPGKNLYSDSVLALNPDNGDIKWYYQYTSNDSWDYDGVNHSVLTDIQYQGKTVKALLHADRNGWFYALDRTNGKFLWAKPFVKVTSVTGHKADGTPIEDDSLRPDVGKKVFTCPSALGGKNWWPMSVDPKTGLAYVPTLHMCWDLEGTTVSYQSGLPYLGEKWVWKHEPGNDDYGEVQAININTGEKVWSHPSKLPWNGGMLSTASGLVFSGGLDRHFYAFDGKTGKVLWKSKQLASAIIGVPTTYMVDGHQYVAVYAGYGGVFSLYGQSVTGETAQHQMARGGRLYVFEVD